MMTNRWPRVWRALLLTSLCVLAACLPPALPRVLKIGLVAPFEGRYRYVGYDAIYAARLAVREINAAGGAGGWRLELVAYDDRADPGLADTTAHNLVIDPDVMAVIGHYRQASTEAAGAVYAEAGMPLLAVGAWLTPTSAPAWSMAPPPEQVAAAMRDAAALPPLTSLPAGGITSSAALVAGGIFPFNSPLVEGTFLLTSPPLGRIEGGNVWPEGTLFVTPYPLPRDLPGLEAWDTAYRAVGPHVPDPGVYALPTYEAVYTLAEAIDAVVESGERPSRAGVAAVLPGVQRVGALGTITWDAARYWQEMPLYIYVWEQGRAVLVDSKRETGEGR